ncbi:MAG: hypothetical protein LAT84_11835 [Balneolia bacterium]|nr:hypothetical protein [Balneolia bacterium]
MAVCISLFLSTPNPAFSQTGNEHIRHFTSRDGISNSFIWKMVQDHHGFIWTAGSMGIERFDGTTFTLYAHNPQDSHSIPSGEVRALLERADGTFWVGASSGLAMFDPSTELAWRLKTAQADSLPDFQNVWGIREDENRNIWAGSAHGLYFIPNQDFRADTIDARFFMLNPERQTALFIRDIEIIDENRLLVGTNSGLHIFSRDDETFTRVHSDDDEVQAMLSSETWQLMTDRSGTIWISTFQGLAVWRDGADAPEPVNRFTNSDLDLAGEMIQSVFEDEEGLIYVGTAFNGAFILDPETMEITRYRRGANDALFLAEDDVHYFMKDPDGNYWFGYHYSGMSVMYRELWDYTFSLPDETQERSQRVNQIRALYLDSYGNSWYSTNAGVLFRSADGTETELFLPPAFAQSGLLRDVQIYLMIEVNGFVFASTFTELLAFDIENRSMRRIDLPFESSELGMPQYHNNHLYTGADGVGLVIVSLDDFSVTTFPNIYNDPERPTSPIMQPVVDIEGNIWVYDFAFTLPFSWMIYLFDPETRTFNQDGFQSPAFQTFTSRPSPSLTEPGVVWVTSERGLLKQNFITRENEFFLSNNAEVAAMSNFLISTDSDGYVWLGGMTHLLRFDPITGNVNTFHPEAARRPLFMLMQPQLLDGRMAAVGDGGYITFNPNEMLEERSATFMHITEIRSGTNITNLLYEPLDPRGFDSGSGNITLSFVALNYRSPASTRYRYRLIGHHDEWIEIGAQNQVYLANLRPGSYTFEVQSRSASGNFGESTASLSFTIRPPWWQTLPAYIFFALLIAGGIVATDRVQRRRVIMKERERAREKELEQAREIEKAYHRLELAHENLKSAQQQLVQQEKLASLGQLTAGIAHEIKNPLNFVNNFSEITIEMVDEIGTEMEALEKLKNGAAGKPFETISSILVDVRSNLQKIYEHGSRADAIVRSMLLHSRGGSGRMEPTDLNAVIREYVNLAYHGMRAAKDPISVQIELDLDEAAGLVPLIAEDFSRVILNLCNNAFDAMRDKLNQPEAAPYKPKLTVRTKVKDDAIIIYISDNGPGIPAALRDKIMQPFFTTKKGTLGTGLGLSITHDIVKAHGGQLSVDSEPGSSTTFTITLSKNEEAKL